MLVPLIKIVDRIIHRRQAARAAAASIRCPPVAAPPWPPACRLSTPRPATESLGGSLERGRSAAPVGAGFGL